MRFCATSLAGVLCVAAAACSGARLTSTEAAKQLEASPRFRAPETFRVRTRYCVGDDAATSPGLARLKALENAGAIQVERKPAAAGECTTLSGPTRQRFDVTLTSTGAGFHPEPLENGLGWDFVLAHRRVVGVKDITTNDNADHPIARVLYQWAWKDELIGQLAQVSEEPVNAQASFTLSDGQWVLRDPGF